MMSSFFRFAAAAAAIGGIALTAAAAPEPPNIVLIMADDMGYECLSANGGSPYQTPRLDALAAEGIRFAHCHSQPICTPSRVQIMTGIYNNRNYLRFGLLDPAAHTFGHALKAAGYATGIAGKWQLSGGMEAPPHFGFDRFCLWQLDRRPRRYANPGFEIDGKRVDFADGQYGPDIASDYLCAFIEKNKDRRFFAYYPMIPPHFPFEPTPDSPDYDRGLTAKEGLGKAKYFQGMVEYTDKIVGKIVDKLEALGIRENTLVLFTGDNGTHPKITSQLDGRDYPGGKGSTRDSGTHVPLIASWPAAAPKGIVSEALVDFSDFFPTLAEIAGAKVPGGIDGVSFAPVLRGENPAAGREAIYCWYHRDGVRDKASQHARDRRFKLYADGRFFDTESDPAEKSPLAENALSDEARASLATLRPFLKKHVAATEAEDARRAAK